MKKLIIILVITLFLIGCPHSNKPTNITNETQYENDIAKCLNSPLPYKECMGNLGYKYQ